MRCKPASTLFTIATGKPDLIPLFKTKQPYFTHRGIWQAPWREAAEPYDVLSIIPSH